MPGQAVLWMRRMSKSKPVMTDKNKVRIAGHAFAVGTHQVVSDGSRKTRQSTSVLFY